MSHTPVSAVIISKNEEQHIAHCLKSLTWADEILVVDAESSDRTPEICTDKTQPWAEKIRFLQRKWPGFREQRNFAMNEAKNDWVLVVDSDEICTPELAQKIQNILDPKATPPAKAFKVRRVEYFLGKPIHFGIWNPSYQDRFFHRAGVKYVNNIHEYPLFPAPAQLIHEPLLHFPEFNVERFLDKMNRYTTIEAKDRIEQGKRTNWFRLIGAFPAMFWKNYIYYKAYKDGFHGFVISLLEGVSRVVRHIKIWQYTRGKK
jgi:glycosyltransferase involved in cell wall biosynthesis